MDIHQRLKILTRIMLTFMAALLLVGVTHSLSSSYHYKSAQAGVGFAPSLGALVPTKGYFQSLVRDLEADPDRFLHLTGREIVQLFSKPDMIRQEGAVSVFQYRNDACVLDLYFNAGPDQFLKASVQHYEVRPRGYDAPPGNAELAPCVHDLLRAMYKPGILGINLFR